MFLLAQFREPRAYPLIVEFFAQPGAASDECTGEVVTEDLPRILASVAAGDWKPMAAMFENRELDGWVRGAALRGMTILALDGELERDEMISYLRRLFAGGLDQEDHVFAWPSLRVARTRSWGSSPGRRRWLEVLPSVAISTHLVLVCARAKQGQVVLVPAGGGISGHRRRPGEFPHALPLPPLGRGGASTSTSARQVVPPLRVENQATCSKIGSSSSR